jgi:hypothetical protein
MKNIKRVLTERWYAREDAWKIVLNNKDPEVTWNQEEERLEYTPQVIDTESVRQLQLVEIACANNGCSTWTKTRSPVK